MLVVLKGSLATNGMASFADALSPDDVAAIHAYLVNRQRELYLKDKQRAGGR